MEKYKYAGKKLKVREGVGLLTTGQMGEGQIFEAEDYWINLPGNKSWMWSDGNPACLEYAMRTALQTLKVPTFDDLVVYGKIDGFGHLFHETELELIPEQN